MRRLSVVGLVLGLAVAAGCGGPPELTVSASPGRFHEKEQNRTVSGEQIPLKFLDIAGKAVDLASFRGKSNVVLVIVKGLPERHPPGEVFCPGCLAQVHALTANFEEFKRRNAEILMVFPGPTDQLPDFLATAKVDGADGNLKVPFPLLKDTDLNAVDALDIRGDRAKPSTYILDKSGNAVFAYVGSETNSFDRPSVKALLAQLDKLNANK